MEKSLEVLLQVAQLARTAKPDNLGEADLAPSVDVRSCVAEISKLPRSSQEILWADAAENGVSLQSLTG